MILMVSSVATFVLTAVTLGMDYFADVQVVEDNLELVKKSYAQSLTKSLWELNESQINVQMKGILGVPGIHYVEIIDQGKRIGAEGVQPIDSFIQKEFPLVFEDSRGPNLIGKLVVYSSLQPVRNKLYRKMFVVFLTQFLKTIIVSLIIFLLIERILTRHLVRITDYLKHIDFYNPTNELTLSRHKPESVRDLDELDVLVDAIHMMRNDVQRSQKELSDLNRDLEEQVQQRTNVIIEQRERLEYSSKMSALGKMAGGMAHEINSPLTIVQLHCTQIEKALQSEPVNKSLIENSIRKIELMILRTSKIIKALRFFSRTGENDPYIEVSLESIWAESIDLCQSKFSFHNIDLCYDPIPNDLYLYCNATQISQVLLNLLDNAFDAVEDQEEKWVEFKVQQIGKFVRLTIRDSGKGIVREVRSKIFEPFFTTKEVGKGTGLGLSISKGIIESHGGKFFLDDNEIQTTFVVELPLSLPKQLEL